MLTLSIASLAIVALMYATWHVRKLAWSAQAWMWIVFIGFTVGNSSAALYNLDRFIGRTVYEILIFAVCTFLSAELCAILSRAWVKNEPPRNSENFTSTKFRPWETVWVCLFLVQYFAAILWIILLSGKSG